MLWAVGWKGGLGQVLAKGLGWSSRTSGSGDLDPSSWNSDSGEGPVRGERPVGALCFCLHVQVKAAPRKDSTADDARALGGLQARQVGVFV